MFKTLLNTIADIFEELTPSQTEGLNSGTGTDTGQQWDHLPALKRGLEWDQEGRLFVHEVKQCPVTGLKVRISREITSD